MTFVFNIDILSVGIAIAANIILGFVIFVSNKRNITTTLFFLQTIILSLWSVANYLTYQITDLQISLWMERMVIFLAVPNSIVFLLLMYHFPEKRWLLSRKITLIGFVVVVSTMFLTLTPYIFSGVRLVAGIPTPQPVVQPGILLFAVVSVLSIPVGIYFLIVKYVKSTQLNKSRIGYLLLGAIIMFLFIVILDFVFPVFINDTQFIPFSAVFTFPFVGFTFYSIYRHQLFNIRAALVAGLTFILSVSAFIEIIFSTTVSVIILRSAVFILVLAISIMMNRFVQTIAEQREKLVVANEGQQQFIHYLNHESKGYLTDDNVVLAAVRDQDFGPTSPELQKMATTVLRKNARAVDDIDEMILGADLGSGVVRYTMEPFDLAAATRTFVDEYRPDAEEKQQKLEFRLEPADGDFTVVGDKRRLIRHALKNYLKNAIVYTPVGGTISVTLSRVPAAKAGEPARVRLAVHDSGVGIAPEDKPRLFTEGGKGLHSTDVNPNSTGRGLFIVKQILDAHHGRVFADSEGAGKGATFGFEVPVG